MENVNEIVAGIKVEMVEIRNRLNSLEKLTESVHEMAINLTKLTTRQEQSEKRLGQIANDVEEIKEKPGKRWDAAIAAIVAAALGAFVTYLVTMTLK